jgi:hypothetical protein
MGRAKFEIEAEWDRTQGKFASREEIVTEILQWLEDANFGNVSGIGSDGDSDYDITSWEVNEVIEIEKKRR